MFDSDIPGITYEDPPLPGWVMAKVSPDAGWVHFHIERDGSGNDLIVDLGYMTEEIQNINFLSVVGSSNNDTIIVSQEAAAWEVGVAVEGGAGNDDLQYSSDDGSAYLSGGPDQDNLTIVGKTFRSEMYGRDGHDVLLMSGENADSTIEGGKGNDLIDCRNNTLSVFVQGGDDDDTIYGSSARDILWGGQGVDYIWDGGGDPMEETSDIQGGFRILGPVGEFGG
jgi:Ca2+-binding RTX toxin-like protein